MAVSPAAWRRRLPSRSEYVAESNDRLSDDVSRSTRRGVNSPRKFTGHINRKSATITAVTIFLCLTLFRRNGGSLSSLARYDFGKQKMRPAPPLRPGTKQYKFRALASRENTLHASPCYAYGCPIYPLEVLPDFIDDEDGAIRDLVSFGLNSYATKDHVALSMVGFKGNTSPNQDRGVIMHFPIDDKDIMTTANKTKPGDFLLGIFDGHGDGGEIVADCVASEITGRLYGHLSEMQDDATTTKILVESFLALDLAVPNVEGGCTASLTLRLGDRLYVANAGDSSTVVVAFSENNYDHPQILYRSRKDKPDLESERSRIEKAGGEVYLPPPWLVGDSSRVLVPDKQGSLTGLAMSRSIGDRDAKDYGVVAEPIVGIVDLSSIGKEVEVAVIAASDGLWDMVEETIVLQTMGRSFYQGESQKDVLPSPLVAATQLILEAGINWRDDTISRGFVYRDDISLIGTKIKR
uniref:PPM-type phosphatase domain-containing protein n=1 Tax=Corethron hystrix TaxID=216773 RepID=A0A7S1FPF6_9STRA|mmetsp:Transcript_18489/g.42302  ORF Transcript_18489/g.42302 Transcript_18489/m.42302 type:complete len:465 (+) Transcript_18489:69-1463(+)